MNEQAMGMAIQAVVVGAGLIVIAWTIHAGLWRKAAFADAPPRPVGLKGAGLLAGVGAYLIGAAAFGVLTALADQMGMPSMMEPDTLSPREYGTWMLIGQILTIGVVAAAFMLIAVIVRGGKGLREAGLLPRDAATEMRATAVGAIASLILVFTVTIVVTTVAEQFGYETPELGHDLLIIFRNATNDPKAMTMLLLSAVVMAPLTEEIAFRGLVQSELLSLFGPARRRLTIVIAALLFMAVHISVAQWQTWPGLFALGVALGWLYERYGSLWTCIAVHMVFNAANIGLMFALDIGGSAT